MWRTPSFHLAVGTVLLALTLGGCDSNSAAQFSGQQRAVAETIERFQQAGRQGDIETICANLLAQRVLREFKQAGLSCHVQLGAAIKQTDNWDLTVEKVNINGVRATATVISKHDGKKRWEQVPLVKEDGRWKVASPQRAS